MLTPEAVKCYDRTLERNPDSYITLTNRAVRKPQLDRGTDQWMSSYPLVLHTEFWQILNIPWSLQRGFHSGRFCFSYFHFKPLFAALAPFEPWLTLVIQSGLIISTDGKRAVAFAQAISHHSSSYACNGGAFLNFRVPQTWHPIFRPLDWPSKPRSLSWKRFWRTLSHVPQPGGIWCHRIGMGYTMGCRSSKDLSLPGCSESPWDQSNLAQGALFGGCCANTWLKKHIIIVHNYYNISILLRTLGMSWNCMCEVKCMQCMSYMDPVHRDAQSFFLFSDFNAASRAWQDWFQLVLGERAFLGPKRYSEARARQNSEKASSLESFIDMMRHQ